MKKLIFPTTLFALFFLLSTVVFAADTETRSLGDFDELSVSGGVTVTIKKGNQNKAEIKTENVETSEVITEVEGGELSIKFKKNSNWFNNRKATITLTYKSIDMLSVSSGSTLKSDGTISAGDFDLDVSSGSTCTIDLSCSKVNIDVSSGATAIVSGNCSSQDVDVSSGSTYKASDFKSGSATVDASSGASAMIWVTDSLNADASSGASIKYKGDPKNKDVDSGWSGSVKKA